MIESLSIASTNLLTKSGAPILISYRTLSRLNVHVEQKVSLPKVLAQGCVIRHRSSINVSTPDHGVYDVSLLCRVLCRVFRSISTVNCLQQVGERIIWSSFTRRASNSWFDTWPYERLLISSHRLVTNIVEFTFMILCLSPIKRLSAFSSSFSLSAICRLHPFDHH